MPLNKSWHDYNESLIERGRILMDISFLGSSKKEIKNMNKGKVGAAFEYSHTYIQFLAFLKIGFKIAYRTVQGIIRGLSDYIKIQEIHFTQIRRRILKVKPSVGNLNLDNDNDDDDDNKPITLIVDASGLTITKKGDYIEQKWIRKKKDFIKLHIAVDAESKKVVSFRVTKGNIHDSKKFSPMVKEVSEQYDIDKVYADKAHDNRRSFNLLDGLNIEPAINIRKNASIKTKGCPLRRDEVLLIKKLGYERCKQLNDMGRRWIAEIVFSSLKRVLGEDLLSRKFKAQKIEAGLKVMLYNKFMSF
ncbi:MAG: IS5 family transposase [Nitrososphaeraceae archaeon]